MSNNFKKEDGTGMVPPANAGAPAGAVTSTNTPKKNPRQGIKIDRNKMIKYADISYVICM